MLPSRDIHFYKGLLYWLFSIETKINNFFYKKFKSLLIEKLLSFCPRLLLMHPKFAIDNFLVHLMMLYQLLTHFLLTYRGMVSPSTLQIPY